MSLANLRPTATAFIDRAMPGGPMASHVLPPDYNPADINPYAPGSKLNQGLFNQQLQGMDLASTRYYSPARGSSITQEDINDLTPEGLRRLVAQGDLTYSGPIEGQQFQQGMFMPQFMPMYQPQPTDGISSAVSQISGGMGDEYTNSLLSALGMGDVSQYQMQQPMMNPYAGMLSGYGMTAQPQFDPYALPTSPQANPFGGYTDYTGVNQDFINVRNNLITEISQRTGRSPTEALELINRTGILDGIITGMGGSRYGESSATASPNTGGFGGSSSSSQSGGYGFGGSTGSNG